jgi:hypothetical protein
MRRIIGLYPKAWRARYGEEMETILQERASGPFELVDLLLGALDAHLHLRGLGDHAEHRKGVTMSLRTAGIAAIVGGVFWGLTWLLIAANEILTAGDGDVPFAFLSIFVSVVAILVALAGLSAYQARVHRLLTWVSFLLPAAGIVLLLVGFLGMWVADGMYTLGLVGLLAFIIGTMLFGAVTYVTGALSRTAAALLTVGSGVQLVGMLVMFGIADWDSPVQFLALAGVAAGSVGWIVLGADATRRDRIVVSPTPSTS